MSTPSDQRQTFSPLMSPDRDYEEINTYVVCWGLFFAVLFALAVGYLALKIGQTVDAFAPVSVLAMGMAVLFHRKNAFPETVHIQAIASAGTNVLGSVLMALGFGIFFHLMCAESMTQTVLAFIVVTVFAVLLSVVGISSIAYTGNEPVSGMTIFMIIVSAVVMGGAGMHGKVGIIAILMMASFLCTTLAVAGNFMSELKVAHITGATPRTMERWQLVSIILSGFVSVGVVFLLNHAYGFTGEGALQAPQANAMAAIVQPMMETGDAPWPLYMAGAFFAVLLWMMKIPPLPFALGAYLPMGINTPVLVGGFISWLVSHSSKDEKINSIRLAEGNTVASGFVAGGAIGSLISAVLHIAGIDWFAKAWANSPAGTAAGLVAYFALCTFLVWMAKRGAKDAA